MDKSTVKILALFIGVIIVISLPIFGVVYDLKNTSVDRDTIEDIVADYIKDNPKDIIDALSDYQRVASEERFKEAQKIVDKKIDEIENDNATPFVGNKDAEHVLVEFFDYSCGYCRRVLPDIEKLIETNKNVKVVFKEFPILGDSSLLASKAALAVHSVEPERYFDFHKALMTTRVNGKEAIIDLAKKLGINSAKMQQKMQDPELDTTIANNRKLASEISVRGTPAFVINGKLVPGAIDYEMMVEKLSSNDKTEEDDDDES